MSKQKQNEYDLSTDYQLPPGPLWWDVSFKEHGKKKSSIVFWMDTGSTWYKAKERARILIADELGYNVNDTHFKVTLLGQY